MSKFEKLLNHPLIKKDIQDYRREWLGEENMPEYPKGVWETNAGYKNMEYRLYDFYCHRLIDPYQIIREQLKKKREENGKQLW